MSVTIIKNGVGVVHAHNGNGNGNGKLKAPQTVNLSREVVDIPNISAQYFAGIKNEDPKDAFKLDDEFISLYEHKQPNFGFNGLGELVFFRTYSRLKENNTKETFCDMVRRVVEGCYEIQRRHCRRLHIPWDYHKALISAHEMFQRIWDFKFTPPGRGLWMMGTPFMWERGSAALNNCGFVSTHDLIESDPAEPFCFLMDMSMLGVGVGFDTKGAGKILIHQPADLRRVYIIPDSREGWVDSVRHLIRSYTTTADEGYVEFDYSHIRPAGTTINGFGGKASGPGILMELHMLIRRHLDRKIGETLSSVDITDLMNYIGRCVVAGNVRRCLPRGTLIHLKRGLTPIELVQVGDLVLTANGYYPVAENVFQGTQRVVTINTQMGPFRCTDRHRVAVMTNVGSYEWKRAFQLQSGDRMVFVDTIIQGTKTTLPGYSDMSSRGNILIIPGLTTDVAWFLGAIHGDGYVYPGRHYKGRAHHGASVTIPVNRDEYHDDITNKVEIGFNAFGVNDIGEQPSADNCRKIRVISKRLAAYLYQHVKQAKTPLNVPECIRLGLPEIRAAYLAGLMDTDGSTKNRPTTLVSSVYRDFLRQIRAIYASFGIPTKLRLKREANSTCQAKWELSLVGDHAITRFIEHIQPYAVKQLPTQSHSGYDFGYPTMIIEEYTQHDYGRSWSPQQEQMTYNRATIVGLPTNNLIPVAVESIVDEDVIVETYDLSIPDKNEFVAEGLLVHNTAEIAFGDANDLEYQSMKNYKKTLLPDDISKFEAVTSRLWEEALKISKDNACPQGELCDFEETGIPHDRLIPAIETWNAMNYHRWASNNSIFASVGMDYTDVASQIAVNGEPGLIWLDNVRDFGRLMDGRQPGIDGRVLGANPCMEQSLESYELCVSGDTKLQLRNGVYSIDSLVGRQVEIWNGDDWSMVTPRVTGHNRELYRVHLSDGSYLDTTSNHGWSVRPVGKRIYRRVETNNLQPGDRIHGFTIGKIAGRHEKYAFEMGYATGDGYIDQGGRYTMAVACGQKAKLKELAMAGCWYKPQIKESYTDPYNRINLSDCLSTSQVIELRDKKVGLPEFVMSIDRESILQFIAGWIESDGCVCKQTNTHGYRIYGLEAKIRDAQLLLRRVGINHASINFCHPAGQVTNKGVRENDLWYIQIPSFECGEIPTRLKKATKIGNRLRPNPRYKHRCIDMAKKQYVERVEKLDGLHTTYCFDEPDNHMGVFGNAITYQCNLVETFPANHENAEDYMRTLKFAYLYAKTVTLLPTHNPRTNQVTLRNRRIGLSQSGIVQAFMKFGRRTVLRDFCDAGYNEIRRWDSIYAEWLCVQRSIKVTSVKPSGTVSLVVGTTPGIHHPEAMTYWRRVRIARDSVLVKILQDAGYHVEPTISDPERTVVVKFAIDDRRVRPVQDVSIWEQMANAVDYQRYWADNQVSCTVKFKTSERADIARVLETYEDQLKGISFLPMEDHGYAQAPYEPCTPEEVAEYNLKIKPANYDAYIMEAAGSYFCDNEKCVLQK